jgi:hypothetical protein
MVDGVGGDRLEPVAAGLAAEILASCPARVPVRGLDPGPVAALLEHLQRLARESLRHLLGIVGRLGAKRRELACERMFA